MPSEMDLLVIRWQKALWELTLETGQMQRLRTVSDRAGLTPGEGVIACTFAVFRGITGKIHTEEPGVYMNEYFPIGEH